MAIKYEKIQEGQTLFDVHREKMGNTTMTRLGCWDVKIVKLQNGGAIVSWNGNRDEWWSRRRLEKLYAKEPPSYLKERERRQRSGW